MNQLGWCLEQIQIEMARLPSTIEREDNVILANEVLGKVINLAITLEKVISDKDFKNILYQLEHQSFEGIKFQAQHIEKMFNEMHQMLDLLNRYILDMRRVIDKRDQVSWVNAGGDIVKMIILDCSNKYYELKDEFKVVLHTEKQLRNLLVYEEHLEKVLK